MSETRRHVPPDIWMRQILEARAAQRGGVVRRSRRDIDRTVGWPVFEAGLRRRGYHAVQSSGQVVIF